MSKRITIAEIEDFANFPAGSGLGDMARLLLEAAQRLADSPCPVCGGDYNYDGLWHQVDGGYADGPCPRCGGFPPGRRGKAFESKEAAIDSLMVGLEP